MNMSVTISQQNQNQNCHLPEINEKKPTLMPFYLNDKFIDTQLVDSNGIQIKSIKATEVILLKQENLKGCDIGQLVKTGRIACVILNNGEIQKLTVHPSWYEKIIIEKALDLILTSSDSKSTLMKSEKTCLVKMTENSYQNMIKSFNLDKFAK